ncbi:anhydro-N-acetylmuramic acid kinase [Luteimonas yindakuii]|uniref:Anhydro-N-acetylmuramic acid kinase n=1 Tax=Luteimonas yindakuii TaxID=2565782 RepID=A0A4Z1R0W0_9GAMM|nr:anhydro-N-acetylmuramic acid kinase [Luteimonas yindakuii]TKS53122.1 anhydro-N-acetylmuramic acid kinase [Luteimonas yindakuii]
MPSPVPDVFLGLMSGTSADGIDAALVRFADIDGRHPRLQAELLFGRTYAWDPTLRARLVELGQHDLPLGLDDVGELDTRIATALADAASQSLADSGLRAAEVAAIGSHGQTLRHRPHGRALDGRDRFTLQLGDPGLIAERTGITTVADFRRRDVAAGGQGAPLLPALHAALLQHPHEPRAVLNLGGIANLTLLPAGRAHDAVRGFDTGPANGLLDAWCQRHRGQPYDRGGLFAASGQVDQALLARLRDEPWFALPPPKSSGRDQFHLGWVESRLAGRESPADVQATLLALTVTTVADALRASGAETARVIACGGGVHNPVLMQALAAALPCELESSTAHGLDPDFVEAMGFAWLARQTLRGLPGNLPSVTGAAGPRVLGGIYPA